MTSAPRPRKLVVIHESSARSPFNPAGVECLPFSDLRNQGKGLVRWFRRYAEVEFQTYRIDRIHQPLLVACLMRFLSRGVSRWTDDQGGARDLDFRFLAGLALARVRDSLAAPAVRAQAHRETAELARAPHVQAPTVDWAASPLYLRTDLWFGVKSGGSVGHIAGVVNRLGDFAGPPIFMTTDKIPTVREDLESHLLDPGTRFFSDRETLGLAFNPPAMGQVRALMGKRRPAFIYQRYGVNQYAGLALAREWKVPYVSEYNGSEVWIARKWGKPLRQEALSLSIEELVLKGADLVTVVSRPMKDDLVKRGIPENRILVNPNGVDPDKYSPTVDGSEVNRRLGLEGKKVIGFIGTFGRWHGAELLAEAFGRLLAKKPEWKKDVRLLMIGDGLTLPEVKSALDRNGIRDLAILTGLVPQAQGPAHLAACDILVNPTVPNADGTPFFGSPTKLFEYMAMGKGIVASDLDQIGEVLAHGKTAWLVKPGDLDSLVAGLERLLWDPAAAQRLGQAAREEALAKYTWKSHTGRILEKLQTVTGL